MIIIQQDRVFVSFHNFPFIFKSLVENPSSLLHLPASTNIIVSPDTLHTNVYTRTFSLRYVLYLVCSTINVYSFTRQYIICKNNRRSFSISIIKSVHTQSRLIYQSFYGFRGEEERRDEERRMKTIHHHATIGERPITWFLNVLLVTRIDSAVEGIYYYSYDRARAGNRASFHNKSNDYSLSSYGIGIALSSCSRVRVCENMRGPRRANARFD